MQRQPFVTFYCRVCVLIAGFLVADLCAAGGAANVLLVPHAGDTDLDIRIQAVQKRLREDPEKASLSLQLGWLFVQRARTLHDPGSYKLAEFAGRRVFEADDKNADAALLLGHALHSLHRFAEAERVAKTLCTIRGVATDHALLGDAQIEQGKLSLAITSYERLMDLRPGPVAYARAAHARWIGGDLAGAIEAMSRAAKARSGDPEVDAWHRVRLGEWLLSAGETKSASALAGSALSTFPAYPPALLLDGRCRLAQGNRAQAVTQLERAAERLPLPQYQWALLDALDQEVGGEGAVLRQAQLHEKLLSRGARDDARTVSLYLATVNRDIPRALELATQERRVRQDVHTEDAVAWALFRSGQLQKAREHVRRALAHGTLDPRLQLHAAAILQACGEVRAARTALLVAKRLRHGLLRVEQQLLQSLEATLASTGEPTK